nr:MAG TPA: hypothetical protein [Caudoviricetes sp.]
MVSLLEGVTDTEREACNNAERDKHVGDLHEIYSSSLF